MRMGLHTGEAQERDGDYFGPSVNRAVRLMAVATGGQIVMSSATADMVEGRLTDGVRLTDLGERELRGVARPERMFGLMWPGAPVFEPAAARVAPVVGNLPRARQALLGREREVETVCGLLGEGRLVTLTGVGGVGKTSLALGVAARLAGGFGDGV